MYSEFINSLNSSLDTPYREFCEEYIRLAELIIFFDKDQMEIIDEAEKQALTSIIMGVKTLYSQLGEKRTRIHFNLKRARLIDEFIRENSGVRQVYEKLNNYVCKHHAERKKLNLVCTGSSLTSEELYDNYLLVVKRLKDFNVRLDVMKKN